MASATGSSGFDPYRCGDKQHDNGEVKSSQPGGKQGAAAACHTRPRKRREQMVPAHRLALSSRTAVEPGVLRPQRVAQQPGRVPSAIGQQ